MVSQVKGGSTGPADVQAFNGARQQAGADLGIFTCFENRVTTNMRNAAVSAGRFMDVPRVKIYTIEDYCANRRPEMRRKIVVPDHKYQPTKAEMEEVIAPPPGLTFEEAVRRVLRSTEEEEVSAEEWRKRRDER